MRARVVYINYKGDEGTETVDMIESYLFDTWKEFQKELKEVLKSYRELGMDVWQSSRPCKNW